MNFATSTQQERWTFTADALVQIRNDNREKAVATIKQLREAEQQEAAPHEAENGEKKKKKGKLKPITVDDEKKLLKYYSGKISKFCSTVKLPVKVKTTAQLYLKRFYLGCCVLDHSPAFITIACIYLAAKIEESYISAEQLANLTSQKESVVLATEPILLEGLKLDLIVYGPYRSLSSYIQELEDQRTAGDSPDLAFLSDAEFQSIKDKSHAACDVLLNTDAPLIYPPAHIALAALRSAMKNFPKLFDWFLETILQGTTDSSQTDGGGGQKLKERLGSIDLYGVEGAAPMDEEEVRKIDRQLKACHNPLNDPNSKEYQQRKAAEKLKLAQAKAEKRAAKNSRIKAANLSLLGEMLGPALDHPADPLIAGLRNQPAMPDDAEAVVHSDKRQKLNPE